MSTASVTTFAPRRRCELDPPGLWALCLRLSAQAPLGGPPVGEVVAALVGAAEALRAPDHPGRLACEREVTARGGSAAVWRWGLFETLAPLTAGGISTWIRREVGDVRALEGGVPDGGLLRLALPPRLIVHVQAGNALAPALVGIASAALLRAPLLVKLPHGEVGGAELLLEELSERCPALGGRVAVARWPGGERALEEIALGEAEVLLFHGSDEALSSLRGRAPAGVKIVAHPHRFSVTYLSASVLGDDPARWVGRLALDVAAYDQGGCLSPQVIFAQAAPGDVRLRGWGQALGEALAELSRTLPRGLPPPEVLAEIHQRRATALFTGEVWSGLDWTVTLEDELTPHPGGRFVPIVPVPGPERVLSALGGEGVRRLQGLSLAAADDFDALALTFARAGVHFIARPGRIQRPPLGWPADGRTPLAELIRWAWVGGDDDGPPAAAG